MDPIKIVGGVLVLLGCIFRAISLAYFAKHARFVPDSERARKQFAGRRHRALVIDALFVVMGFYLILTK